MSLLDTRGGSRGIDTPDFAPTENRTIADARVPIEPRSVGSSDELAPVVTARYIAPVREPLQPRDTLQRGQQSDIPVVAPTPDSGNQTPFGTAFSDFLGGSGGGGGFSEAPTRVIPANTPASSNSGLLIILALIGAAGAIWYLLDKHKKGGANA